MNESLLVNALGHSAGLLIFGIFLVLLLRDREQSVRVAGGVGEEPDEVALIVDAVDRGGTLTVRVIDHLEPALWVQVKPCVIAVSPVPTAKTPTTSSLSLTPRA